MRVTRLAIASALLAMGCGRSDEIRLRELCEKTTTMGPDLCRCVAEQATIELSPDARALLVALLEKRADQAEQLRNRISLEDATKAGTFLIRAPATCAIRQRAPSRTEGSP